jgi:hypothetical protein
MLGEFKFTFINMWLFAHMGFINYPTKLWSTSPYISSFKSLKLCILYFCDLIIVMIIHQS